MVFERIRNYVNHILLIELALFIFSGTIINILIKDSILCSYCGVEVNYMEKELPSLSDFPLDEWEKNTESMKFLLTGFIIFFEIIMYVGLLIILIYVVVYQPGSIREASGPILLIMSIGFLFSLFVAKDYVVDRIIIEMEDEEKFISRLNAAMFKMNFESKRKLESEGILVFKPLDWLNSITNRSYIHIQLVREGKAIINGPKNDIEKLRSKLEA